MSEENPFESSMDGNRFDDSPPFANILMNTEDSSPGQQDIAMDPNVGHRSPLSQGGAISPSQGRSVREFDDQMANLRKENFNLKLRIFFLEEKIPGYKNSSNSEGPESAIKENIDLKVSIESLRQELKSKQDLLQEAAHAINSLEAKLQQAQTESHKIIDDLYHKIKLLEMENREMNQYGSENHLDDLICKSDFQGNIDSVQKVHELEGYIQEYRRTNDELHEKITELEGEIEAKNQNICSLEESVKQMKFQNEELQEQLEIRKREISNSEGKCCELKKLAEAKEEVAERALTENENLLLRIRQIENELLLERCNNEEIEKKVFEKERLITELQQQFLKFKEELQDYKRQVADNTCIIDELETKLKEKNAAYDKSLKIILKLAPAQFKNTKNIDTSSVFSQVKEDVRNLNIDIIRSGDYTGEIAELRSKLKEKDAEIEKLKLEVKKKTANLQNLVNTELWEKNREIERLTKLLNKSNTIHSSSQQFSLPPSSPIHENDQLQLTFTDTEYNRAIKRNKYLQEKVELLIEKIATTTNSSERNPDSEKLVEQLKEDLKKVREEADNTNRWQKQYAEVCTVLTARLEELAGFLDSLLRQKDVLDSLAADKRRAIRKAVDKSLDLSRSINLNNSLSLSGSINSVSLIGEENLSILSNISSLLNMISADNSINEGAEGNKENKDNNRYEKSLKEQAKLIEYLKNEVKALRAELDRKKGADCGGKRDRRSVPPSLLTADIHSESETWSEPDREVSMARIGLEEPMMGSSQLKKKSDTKVKLTSSDSESDLSEISKTVLKLSAQNKDILNSKDETLQTTELNKLLADYKKVNEKLEIEIATFKDRYENTVSELETVQKELNMKTLLFSSVSREKEQYRNDANKLKSQISTLKETLANQEKMYKSEIEKAKQKLIESKEEYEKILNEKLTQQEEQLREKITREAKNTYKDIQTDLEATDRKLKEALYTIEFLQENEADLKKSLIENEKQIRNLNKNANDLAVQASKAVHERTKAITDRIALEEKVDELKYKVAVLEKEKSQRISKLSEMENLLVKRESQIKLLEQQLEQLKCARLTHQSSSEAYHSGGYTSEETAKRIQRTNSHLDVINISSTHFNRTGISSSPDLGIESDAAKTSSVELSTAQTQLLKTIEFPVTATISDASNSKANGSNSGCGDDGVSPGTNKGETSHHDCEKIQRENFELRRKLNRTKRAFEDTYTKLQKANHRKEQIERDIRQQIQKTQKVLRTVRSNMEPELDKRDHRKKDEVESNPEATAPEATAD